MVGRGVRQLGKEGVSGQIGVGMRAKLMAIGALAISCAMALSLATACSGGGSKASKSSKERVSRGLTMVVDQQTGKMDITRPKSGSRAAKASSGAKAAKDNPWTIFVYLCGSDLESDQASATDDLDEMLSATDGENVRFVVEAGGTSEWQNSAIEAGKTQRLVIQDGEIEEVQSLDLRNMGESNTLADFLTWGVASYPAERNGVILWDHGGGSIAGVCSDENFDGDTLTLKELDAALLGAYGTMDGKFDFIGFDACLMGTLETANVLASYADYMYGSEEMEPGSGWDYKSISGYLSDNPNATGAELGKTICDSYYKSYRKGEDSGIVTLSIVDLSKIDKVVKNFNTFSNELCSAAGDSGNLASIVRGVKEADNYGGNNRSEGYTNMVDLRGLAEACESCVPSSSKLESSLEDAVVYSKAGSDHADAGGLSVYYPLMVEDANELAVFEQVCVSPYYLTFVDTVERTSAQDASDAAFDSDSWFEDDSWEWSSDYDYDDDTGWFGYDSDTLDEDYWSYENESSATGESPLISFAKKPGYNADGYYGFALSDESLDYAAAVSAYVYEIWDDGKTVELGETCDVYEDWESGEFYDDFDGRWLSLPDGQNLATYLAERTDDYVVYSSPVRLNGEETNLRIRQYLDDGETVVEGAWDGIDENGMASRNIESIHKGDVIVPQYYSADNDGDDTDVDGEEYKVKGKFSVNLELLQGYEYEYSFIIDDVYGDYCMTDPAVFEVDDEGNVSYK